jgi:hypothetical protein
MPPAPFRASGLRDATQDADPTPIARDAAAQDNGATRRGGHQSRANVPTKRPAIGVAPLYDVRPAIGECEEDAVQPAHGAL